MTSHTRRVLELGVGLGLALTLVLTALADWHQRTAARVRADTIRLHILANSDTWDDQLLKLQVRDAVLAAIPEAVSPGRHPAAGRGGAANRFAALQNAADNGPAPRPTVPRPPACGWRGLPFAARDYGAFALPGGEYTALRIELGAARGRNWFCVLYPALCLSGAQSDYPTKAENALVFGRYEVRFALAELVGRMASPRGCARRRVSERNRRRRLLARRLKLSAAPPAD